MPIEVNMLFDLFTEGSCVRQMAFKGDEFDTPVEIIGYYKGNAVCYDEEPTDIYLCPIEDFEENVEFYPLFSVISASFCEAKVSPFEALEILRDMD